MKASFYERTADKNVRCNLCSHRCEIKTGKRGICGVRENRGGVLETLVYDGVIAANADPVEKKPIFHMLPGSRSFSIATVGCNFKCRFCQNADIAQMPSDRSGRIMGNPASPEGIVQSAVRQQCASIAYTYTEPTVYYELARDTAILAHDKGIKNIFVTNGYMTPEVIDDAAPWLDAANVDLKAYSDAFYRKYCSARLEPVKTTLKRMKSAGVMVEVTTLLIPGLNDDPGELKSLAGFINSELGPETPWHVSRFHPTYRLTDRGPTPVESLLTAKEIGENAGLRYVYIGNVPGRGHENTICHGCRSVLIERAGFHVLRNRVADGSCPDCGEKVYGIWE